MFVPSLSLLIPPSCSRFRCGHCRSLNLLTPSRKRLDRVRRRSLALLTPSILHGRGLRCRCCRCCRCLSLVPFNLLLRTFCSGRHLVRQRPNIRLCLHQQSSVLLCHLLLRFIRNKQPHRRSTSHLYQLSDLSDNLRDNSSEMHGKYLLKLSRYAL
jgi:hypothetical protein